MPETLKNLPVLGQILSSAFAALLVILCISGRAAAAESPSLPALDGVWFTCEFARSTTPPDDECEMFDDEGFIVDGGKIAYLRNTASAETDCRGSKKGQCFLRSTQAITVSRRPVGAARIENHQLLVSYMGCTQAFDLRPQENYVAVIPAKKRCLWTRKRHFYVARYNGKIKG